MIDSPLPPPQLMVMPVRPEPVPPGQATLRPSPAPNGAEAGARHPLTDHQRDDTKVARERPESARRNAPAPQQAELDATTRRQLEALKSRDREVRAHEAAHQHAAGPLARGSANFEYQVGPDGRRYAIGGEVNVETSRTGDPARDIENARAIRRAALAPAVPSAQDLRVASEASAMEIRAQQELQATRLAEQTARAGSEDEAANDAFNPDVAVHEVHHTGPARIGEELDVYA